MFVATQQRSGHGPEPNYRPHRWHCYRRFRQTRGSVRLTQNARDIAVALQALGLRRSVIVVHSMGAFFATALAAQNPELVAGLILIDSGVSPQASLGRSGLELR